MTRNEMKALYMECVGLLSDRMGAPTGGNSDGVFFFFDKPFDACINLDEKNLDKLHDNERVFGVFLTHARLRHGDMLIVHRNDCLFAASMPRFSEDLLTKMYDRLVSMKNREKIRPVPLKWINRNVATIPRGLTSTRFVDCSVGRIASVAIELSHCLVFH